MIHFSSSLMLLLPLLTVIHLDRISLSFSDMLVTACSLQREIIVPCKKWNIIHKSNPNQNNLEKQTRCIVFV